MAISLTERTSASSYRAFISYSHAADGKLAPSLQSALQNFAKPWYRLRTIRVFRDQTSLSANPSLWPAIEEALQASEWFLLMASIDSAKSHWVEQEIRWWLDHRHWDKMLIVLSDGDLIWDEDRSDFDWGRTTALGKFLSGRLESEPLYVDLRWAKNVDHLSLRHSQFRAAVLDLAAPVYGRPKDELDGEDVRQHRRTRRLAWAASIALVILTIGAIAAAGIALRQAHISDERRQEAERERQIAVSRQLAAQSEILRTEKLDFLPTSLLLAIESLRHAFSLEAVQSLQKGLQLLSQRGSVSVKHSKNVNDAVLTPDDRHLITASDDGTARVWDAATGTEQRRLEVGGRVMTLHLSRDGTRLATQVYEGNVVRVWEVATGREIGQFEHPAPVDAIAMAPDGTEVAAGARDGLLHIWSLADGHERLRLPHQNWVRAVAYAPDGSRVVSGSADQITRLWDLANGKEIWRVNHSGRVETVAFSPDGKRVATGGWDLHARVLDSETGREVAQTSHTRVVTKVLFSADGRRLGLASDDGSARIISADSGQPLSQFAPEGGVLDLAFSPNGRLLATAGLSLTVSVWEVESGHEVTRATLKALPANVRFGARDETLIVSDRDGTAQILRLDNTALRHGEALRVASFSPNGRFVAMMRNASEVLVAASADNSGSVRRMRVADTPQQLQLTPDGKTLITENERFGILRAWDAASGTLLWKVARGATDSRYMVASEVSPDGHYLTLSYDQAHELAVLSTITGQVVGHATHDDVIMESRFSPDGRLLVTVGDVTARIWETQGSKELYRLALDGKALGACFSPDGKRLATTAANGIARVWDLTNGRELRHFNHGEWIGTVAFSPDGRLLATSTQTGVRLWQVEGGQEVGRLHHDASCDFIAFSPDGSHLATGSRDHSARVWDVASRREVARMSEQGEAFRVAFDATSRFVLVQHTDAAIEFWRAWLWKPEDLEAETCARLATNLSREEWQRYLNNETYRATCPALP